LTTGNLEWTVALEPRLVLVTCRGRLDLKVVLEIYSEAFEIASREGRRAILIDGMAVTGPHPTVSERYDQGIFLAEESARRSWNVRLAIAAPPGIVDPDRLVEVVATNRLANVKVFAELGPARAWVESLPEPG
jgi:hypothetical protein